MEGESPLIIFVEDYDEGRSSSSDTIAEDDEGRCSSPDTVVLPPEAPEWFKEFNEKFNKELKEQRQFRTSTTKTLQNLESKFTKVANVMVASSPASVLPNMNVQFYNDGLLGAVLGTPGYGASLWTIVKHDTGYYAMSSAHCALEYKMPGGMQFVVMPFEVAISGVEGVCLLKEGYHFGTSYSNNRSQDIIFLKLKGLPHRFDEKNVLAWNDETEGEIKKNFVGGAYYVAGDSLKSPIAGRNIVFDRDHNCLVFMLDTNPEPGHSGTAMIGFTMQQGSEHILTHDDSRQAPCVLGVYTGTTGKRTPPDLRERGVVCPIRKREAFDLKSLEKIQTQTFGLLTRTVELIEQDKNGAEKTRAWTASEVPASKLVYKLKSRDKEDLTAYGVFIQSKNADNATLFKWRRQKEAEEGTGRVHSDTRKEAGRENPSTALPLDDCDSSHSRTTTARAIEGEDGFCTIL